MGFVIDELSADHGPSEWEWVVLWRAALEFDVFGFQLHWRTKRMRFMLYSVRSDGRTKHPKSFTCWVSVSTCSQGVGALSHGPKADIDSPPKEEEIVFQI